MSSANEDLTSILNLIHNIIIEISVKGTSTLNKIKNDFSSIYKSMNITNISLDDMKVKFISEIFLLTDDSIDIYKNISNFKTDKLNSGILSQAYNGELYQESGKDGLLRLYKDLQIQKERIDTFNEYMKTKFQS
mgnify:CR=1 FL=1